MADINFDCPHCGQNLDAPPDIAGMQIACPACGQMITVPTPASAFGEETLADTPPPRPQSEPKPPAGNAEPQQEVAAEKIESPPAAPQSAPHEEKETPAPASEDDKGATVRIDLPHNLDEIERPNRVVTIKRSSMKGAGAHRTGFVPKQQKKKGFWARLFGRG